MSTHPSLVLCSISAIPPNPSSFVYTHTTVSKIKHHQVVVPPDNEPTFLFSSKYLFCFYRHLCWYWCSGFFSFVVSCDPPGRLACWCCRPFWKTLRKKKKMWVEQGTHKKHMVCIHISKFVHSSISLLLLFPSNFSVFLITFYNFPSSFSCCWEKKIVFFSYLICMLCTSACICS